MNAQKMNAQKAAVIGHPIGHTMSPFLHKGLFSLSGIPLEYSVLDIPDLEEGIGLLRELDCFNVTIPHKTAIIPYLDELDEKARACGSVNTVRVKNGKMSGFTTDGPGCRKSLESHGLGFSGDLLLLGNGGAARAIAFEAVASGENVRLTIACRESSLQKARKLAQELSVWGDKLQKSLFSVEVTEYGALTEFGPWDLLLNATSVGMYPKAGESPVPESIVRRCGAVFDAVYNPEETWLLQMAKACGIPAVGGMEMLVYQAAEAHEIWYGASFRPEDLRALCKDANREMERLFGQD